jgi:hypothetical protein
MAAHFFTAKVAYRIHRTTDWILASLPGATRLYHFYLRGLSGSPITRMEQNHRSPKRRVPTAGDGRVIGTATAETVSFAITVNARDTTGVIVRIDLERGVVGWDVIAGRGVSPAPPPQILTNPLIDSCASINRSQENL